MPAGDKIAQWNTGFYRFADEPDALDIHDDTAIERVLTGYCPVVKANFERDRIAARRDEHAGAE